MAVQLTRRRFTVAEYVQLGRTGILHEDDRVELIDGDIVEMSPLGEAHTSCVKRSAALFSKRFADMAIVSVQDPVRLNEHNEPQPDLALLRPKDDFYASGHPTPEDILLIVEVADSSLDYDLRTKLPMYARAGVREVWVLNLIQSRLLVAVEPSPTGYQVTRVLRRGDVVSPSACPDVPIAVSDLLG